MLSPHHSCSWIKCCGTRTVREASVTVHYVSVSPRLSCTVRWVPVTVHYFIFYLSPGPSSSWGEVLGNSSSTLGIGDCALRLSFSSPILAAGRGARGGLWTQDGCGGGPEAVRGGPWRGHPVSFAGRHSQHTALSHHPAAHQVGSTGRCNCNLKQSEA